MQNLVLHSSTVNQESIAPKAAFPAFATIPNWLQISGMGRTSTYEALSKGNLRAVKLGSRTLIDVEHGLCWIRNLPAADVRVSGKNRN